MLPRGLVAKVTGILLAGATIGIGSKYVAISVKTETSQELRQDIGTVVGKSYRLTKNGEHLPRDVSVIALHTNI